MNGLVLCTQECNLRCSYCFEESMHTGCMPTIDEIKNKFASFIENGFEKFVIELIENWIGIQMLHFMEGSLC